MLFIFLKVGGLVWQSLRAVQFGWFWVARFYLLRRQTLGLSELRQMLVFRHRAQHTASPRRGCIRSRITNELHGLEFTNSFIMVTTAICQVTDSLFTIQLWARKTPLALRNECFSSIQITTKINPNCELKVRNINWELQLILKNTVSKADSTKQNKLVSPWGRALEGHRGKRHTAGEGAYLFSPCFFFHIFG